MSLPRPRDYSDWTVPIDENGKEIGDYYDDATHQKYLAWLADYLYYTEIAVPDFQRETLAEFEAKDGIGTAVTWLTDDWGYAVFEIERIEYFISEGLSYAAFHQDEVDTWNGFTDKVREEYGDPETNFYTSEIDFNRIGREAIERAKVPAHIRHVDIPYRAILAKLLKKVDSKEERMKHLDHYFYNFSECASK